MLWLLLSLPLAALLAYLHPRIWIRLDVRAFEANGSKDSLLQTFHRQRTTWRIAAGLLICAVGSFPLWATGFPALLVAVGVLCGQVAWWLYAFNTGLNVARNLPYVGKYHVSWNPNAAAFPDRYVWQKASQQVYPGWPAPEAEDLAVVAVAGPLLQRLLRRCLWVGLATAAALVAGGVVVAHL